MTMSQRNAIIENINYHLDSRVIAASIRPAYQVVAEGRDRSIVQLSEDFVEYLLDDGRCLIDNEHDDAARKELHQLMLGPLGGQVVRATCVRPGDYELAADGEVQVIIWAREDDLASGDFLRAWGSSVHALCERPLEVLTHYEVCPTCSGSGTVVNPSIDAGGITRETFDDDPQFERDYFGGRFDVKCPSCTGKRVVAAVQFRGELALLGELIAEWDQAQVEDAHERARERAYGY